MTLFLLGLNHKTAPVEVREQLSLSASQLSRALRAVRESAGAREAAILSTCNRAEIYALGDDNSAPRLEEFLADFHQLSPNNFSSHLYRTAGGESARHLFRVACGVDSLVLGESQILGQVKSALEAAQNSGAIGGVLDELFRRAISCGKRARAETGIGRGSLSVGAAAVELARQIFGSLSGHTILILGAGKMSELTAQHLVASGAKSVIVANRTHGRAQELAQLFSAETARGQVATRAVTWEEFPAELMRADIVISSTRAPGFVLHAAQVAAAMKARRNRPLLLIDIAVPRDIDPQAHQLDNVYLYDIDDLQGVVDVNRAQRGGELARVEEIVESEVESWNGWYRGLSAQPVMAALSRRAQSVREREVENALAMLPNLSEREREIVRQMGRSIAGKLMHPPLRHLREAGENGSGDVDALRRAFALDEENVASTRDEKQNPQISSGHCAGTHAASTRNVENDAPQNASAHQARFGHAEKFVGENAAARVTDARDHENLLSQNATLSAENIARDDAEKIAMQNISPNAVASTRGENQRTEIAERRDFSASHKAKPRDQNGNAHARSDEAARELFDAPNAADARLASVSATPENASTRVEDGSTEISVSPQNASTRAEHETRLGGDE